MAPTSPLHRPRGFTLMEAAVTLSMAIVVLSAAVMVQVLLTKTFASSRRVSALSDQSLTLGTFLSSELANVGGNGITAPAAIYVEHACTARGQYPACPNGSDRVTLLPALTFAPQCRVSHVDTSVTPIRLSFWQESPVGPICCFNDEKNGIHADGNPDDGPFFQYMKQHIVLQSSSGAFRKPAMIIAEHSAPGATTAPAPTAYADADWDNDGKYTDSRCTFRLIDVVPTSMRVEPPTTAGWLGAKATPVDMRVLFVDSRVSPPNLLLHIDRDFTGSGASPTLSDAGTPNGVWNWSDATTPESETLVVMPSVFDLQVVFGYDANSDGVVAVTERFFDASTETTRNFSLDSTLKTLRIDAVVGARVEGSTFSGASAPTPANPLATTFSRSGFALRPVSVTVTPRNNPSALDGG